MLEPFKMSKEITTRESVNVTGIFFNLYGPLILRAQNILLDLLFHNFIELCRPTCSRCPETRDG